MKGISIIVCCYNSALRLPETLRHLATQEVSSMIPWEVIVVNNASKDNTSGIAKLEWEKYHCKVAFKVIDQPIPGLSAAREKGIETSKFEYVIFCDDDNWLAPNWAQRVCEIFELNSEIGIIGGKNEAVFEIPPPVWFEKLKGSFAVGEQNNETADVTDIRGYVWGAGLSFRKSVYLKAKNAGFKPLLSGRKGNKLTAGEDTEFCYLFRMAGYRIWYFEDLKLQHFIPTARLNEQILPKMYKGFGESLYYFELYNHTIKSSKNPFFLIYSQSFRDFSNFMIWARPYLFEPDRNTNMTYLLFLCMRRKLSTSLIHILNFNRLYKRTIMLSENIKKF